MAKKKKESTEDKLVNLQAAQLAAQVANFAAQLEFQKQRFSLLEMPEWQQRSQLDRDRFAWEKAQAEYERAFQEATVTGTYNGQPTMQWLEQQARMTGVLNGQQTLEGKLTDAQVAQMAATVMNMQRGMDLEYQKFGVDTGFREAELGMKLRDQQASLTGYIDGLPTFEREQWQAQQGQAYLNLLSTLKGASSAFDQLRVLRNTPQAITQMAASWAGQFESQTGGTGTPQRATIAGMMNPQLPQQGQYQAMPIAAYNPMQAPPKILPMPGTPGVVDTNDQGLMSTIHGGWEAPAYVPGVPVGGVGYNGQPAYSVNPPGTPAPAQAYNYQMDPAGGSQVYPPGTQAPPGGFQISSYNPLGQQQQRQMLSESQGVEDPYALTAGLPDPGQINAREYNKATQYERDIGWAGYEDIGWDKGAAQERFKRSLPKYGVANDARGTVRV